MKEIALIFFWICLSMDFHLIRSSTQLIKDISLKTRAELVQYTEGRSAFRSFILLYLKKIFVLLILLSQIN
jgi:hypothetical protein